MNLGLSSYTYVWSVGVVGYPPPAQPMTPHDLLAAAQSLGVGVLQIADNLPLDRLSPFEIQELADDAEERGIRLETGTRGISFDHLRTYLDVSQRLNSSLLRVVIDDAPVGDEFSDHAEQPSVDDIVRVISGVATDFERAGVALAIENHDRFTAVVLRDMMERIGSSHVGICFDTANSIGCLENAPYVLRTLEPWIVNVHLKDYAVIRRPHSRGFVVEGRPAGGGQLDVPALVQQLHSIHYAGSVLVELWPPPQETVDASIKLEHRWAEESVRYLRASTTST